MLQRAACVLFQPINRLLVGERPMHFTRYGWRSMGKTAGEKCLPCDLIPACTTTNALERRSWVKSQHKQYHQPFTIGSSSINNMSGSPLLHATTTMTTEASTLPLWAFPNTALKECHVRLYSTKPPPLPQSSLDENHNERRGSGEKDRRDVETGKLAAANDEKKEDKLTLVQKFKLMYKQYWYVLIPVHVATSVIWYGSFFIAAKSGVDIVPIMEKLGAGEKILSHLQNSNAGYYAIAYAMYKIATPARYTVTIGGTTLSINYLKKRGYIKPVPSSEKLKEMYEVVSLKCRGLMKAVFGRRREAVSSSSLYRPV